MVETDERATLVLFVHNMTVKNSTEPRTPALYIRDKPIYLEEDWDHGIGGGLWSTGLALAKYFGTPHAYQQLKRRKRVLELGSGNGFLGVCVSAAAPGLDVVITDTKEHLPLMEKTLRANSHVWDGFDDQEGKKRRECLVKEYLWGTEYQKEKGEASFDLIIGSDLAYRDELHDPLIFSILHLSTPTTITLLGVTHLDTKPIFFSKLHQAGLRYERLADHLIDPNFRGTNFGIFAIQKEQKL